MKKLMIAAVSALGLFALAACEGGEAPPQNGTGGGTMDGGDAMNSGGTMNGSGTTGGSAGTTDPAQ